MLLEPNLRRARSCALAPGIGKCCEYNLLARLCNGVFDIMRIVYGKLKSAGNTTEFCR